MRKMTAILIGALAAMILAGCVGGPYRHRSAGYVTVYYDGYYGPYSGGYWGPGGYFYYLRDNKYHRDVARHFRRDNFKGGHPVHAERRDRDRDHRDRDRRDRDRR